MNAENITLSSTDELANAIAKFIYTKIGINDGTVSFFKQHEKPIYDYKLYPKIYGHTYPGAKPVYFYNGKNNFLLKIFNLFTHKIK